LKDQQEDLIIEKIQRNSLPTENSVLRALEGGDGDDYGFDQSLRLKSNANFHSPKGSTTLKKKKT